MMCLALLTFLPLAPDTDSVNIRLIASWSDGDNTTEGLDVVVKEGYAYLALGRRGIAILDVRFPEDSGVRVVGRIDSIVCDGLALSGHYLFASHNASYEHRLRAYDISDPTNPKFLSEVTITKAAKPSKGSPCNIEVADSLGLAFITSSGGSGPYIVDISSPEDSMTLLSAVYLDGIATAFLPPHYLYALSGYIYVLDISDPTNPVEVGISDQPTGDGGMVRWGHYLYTGDWLIWGIDVFDISDPTKPTWLWYQLSGVRMVDGLVREDADKLYAVWPIMVFHLLSDGTVSLLGYYNPNQGNMHTVYWDNGYTYVAYGNSITDCDLLIFHFLLDTIGDSLSPGDTLPTPWEWDAWISGRTLHLSLPGYYSGQLSIYNSLGQRVYSRFLELPPGETDIELPELGGGVYMVVLEDPEGKREVLRCLD